MRVNHSGCLSAFVATLFLPVLACTGKISSGGNTGSTGSGSVTGTGTSPPPVAPGIGQTDAGGNTSGGGSDPLPPSAPGVEAPRRLSVTEYRNTVRDLLGGVVTTDDLPVDQQAGTSGFLTGAAITSAPDARLLLDKAELVTTSAIPKLAALVPCISTTTAGDDCARQFISQFGRRAYRRPLADEEVTRLFSLYTRQRGADIGAVFSEAIRTVVMAMLQSPNFLYRWELGPNLPIKDGTLLRFNSQEMASRLSYALWASMPDDRLFQLADSNSLTTIDHIQFEARRMLIDPRATLAYSDFATQWLSLTQLPFALKDSNYNFTPAMALSMLAETGAFISDLFQGPKATGSFEALLTSRSSFIDGTLATIYGASGITGTALQPVTFNASQRAGILTQVAFLTKHGDTGGSFPVRRGAQIYRRLFCREVELPLNLVVVPPPPAMPGQTTRQRFAEHSKNPCAFCHVLFEPLGFAFEGYDGLGQYRTTDNGQSVDATGTVTVGTEQLVFTNAIDLSAKLAKSEQVRDCFATQWMRFVLRRRETPGDMASIQSAQKAFRASSFDMRELVVAISGTDVFSHRSRSEGEVLP
jgi:hypothetical protein